jgi:hypothetical protein
MAPLLKENYLSGIKIDNPILKADGASEGDDDGVFAGDVPSEAENIENGIVEGLGLGVGGCTLVRLLYLQYLQVQLLISASVPKVLAQM